jgi:hypothetical protein
MSNSVIVFIFFSWDPFILPSCNMFLLVVKCALQLDWRFFFQGEIVCYEVDTCGKSHFSPPHPPTPPSGTTTLQELPKGAMLPQEIFWWLPWWAVTLRYTNLCADLICFVTEAWNHAVCINTF